jgi:uroporphyrinogen decarboxylase
MNSRDIVKASLAFASPPRIPYAMGGEFPSDLGWVSRDRATNRHMMDWAPVGDHWEMIDEWGNTWQRIEEITCGEIKEGVVEQGWDLLDTYEFPDVDNPVLYEKAARSVEEHHAAGRYVIATVDWPFNTARYMRRLEVFLADCVESPDRVTELLTRIADITQSEIEHYARIGVDAIMTWEDWGTQDRLLVSPTMFRNLFKPHFQQLCNTAHDNSIDVWFHSCGYVRHIIKDLIEVGVNVLQFDQPELHDIDYLAENFGGRVHFWCPVDIQKTLQTRDVDAIHTAAKEYIEKLALPFGGGFIAGYYGSNDALGVDISCQTAACRAFMECGDPASWKQ